MYTLLIVENEFGVVEEIYVEQNVDLGIIETNLYNGWCIIEVNKEVSNIPINLTKYKMKDIVIYM